MKKVACSLAVLLMLITTICHSAHADGVSIQSSQMFRSVSVQGNSTGTVTFSALLNMQCTSIEISSCTLHLYEDSKWSYVTTLGVPEGKSNVLRYGASVDYSASLTHGNTYRVVVTFTADGESVTKTSNSFSY